MKKKMMAVTRKMKGIEEEEEEEEEQMKKKNKTVKENVEDGVTWRRGKMIGKGSFGSVYLATLRKPPPNKSQLLMAVKSAELSVSKSLQEERKVFNDLQGCPYIIQCFGEETTTSETGETVYNLLLEYASGGSLRDLIEKSNGFRLQDSDVRRYARSILRAIKHVHDSGYVHLDLKPDNILLVPTKSQGKTTTSTPATTKVKAGNNKNKKFMAKVCDFGLAKMVKQQINKKKKKKSESSYYYLRGTALLYMSPEAVADGIQEAASDIWAIGCVVLEMLTGKRVWDRKVHGNTEKLLYNIGYGSDLPEIPSSISEEGKDFLKGCFVRKPADRLTADMLLKLPFVSQAEEDDYEEDAQKVQVLNLNLNLKESLDAQGVSTMLSLSETDDKDDSWLVEPTMMSGDNNDSSSLVDEPRVISEEEEKEEPSICCEYDNDCLMDEPGIISEDEKEPSICPSEAEALEGVDADDEHEEVEASLKKSPDTQGGSSMSDTDNDSDEDETIEEEEDEDRSISPSSEAVEDVDEDAKAEVLKWGSFDPKEVNSGLCLSDESWSDESSSVPEAEDHKKRPVSLAMDDETTTQDHKRRKRMMPSSVAGLKQMMIEYFIANHQPKPVKAIPQKLPSTLPTTAAH